MTTQSILPEDSTAPRSSNDKLVLYMIGHAPDAKYLDRLLDQIKPIISHLCFVNTDDKNDCHEVISAKEIDYSYDTLVFPSREDFDFSQARNKALEMALDIAADQDQFVMWLDCDDAIENPETIIEEIKANDKYTAFAMPYEVTDKAGNLQKIRIHKGDWRWINKVHEELMPDDGKGRQAFAIDTKVVHSPDEEKSNHDFHISLLKKNVKYSPSDYTYLAKEHYNLLKFEEAIEWIKKAIAIHDVDIEIYNLWVMLALSYLQTDREEKAIETLYKALSIRPQRKEAYYYLAEIYGRKGGDNLFKGYALIAACNAQGSTRDPLSNSMIYDSLCYKLQARYEQKQGKWHRALDIMKNCKETDEESEQIIGECHQAIENEQEEYL